MIEFYVDKNVLVLSYTSRYDNRWVYEEIEKNDHVTIRHTFNFTSKHLISSPPVSEDEYDTPVVFKMGEVIDGYAKIQRDILGIDFDLYIHEDETITSNFFLAPQDVSIFSHINKLKPSVIRIGGDTEPRITFDNYREIISKIPNRYEISKYIRARVSSVIREYIDTKVDGDLSYNLYMNKKLSAPLHSDIDTLKTGEIQKYEILLNSLENMLDDDVSYSELRWQDEIIKFVKLIFPKYIESFKSVKIADTVSGGRLQLDIMLLDSSGNVDIIEIKKPTIERIVYGSKYRNNYIPARELSGTVMQIEKYIFNICRWGKSGEAELTKKFQHKIPHGLSVKFINPRGLIIMGRDGVMSADERHDFEVIKRQYKNIADIITYDDLLARLQFTLQQLKMTAAPPG